MRKKRILKFAKTKHNMEVDYDNIVTTEIVPGFEMDIPDITYSVITDAELMITILTILTVMCNKKRKIKLISINLDNYNCEIIVKSNEKDYFDFCDTFLKLRKEDIEKVEINS